MRQPWDFTNEDPGLAAARAVAGKGKVRMLRDPGDPETSTLAALHHQPPVWTGQPHDPDSWCPSFPQQNTSILSPTAFPMRFPPSTEPFFFFSPPTPSRRPLTFREVSQGRNNPLDWIDQPQYASRRWISNLCRLIRPSRLRSSDIVRRHPPALALCFSHYQVPITMSKLGAAYQPRAPSRRMCNHTFMAGAGNRGNV